MLKTWDRIRAWLLRMNRNLEQRFGWIHLTYALPHEACHYLVARAFGFKPRFKLYSVRFYPPQKNGWRAFVVIIAPITLGFVPPLLTLALTLWQSKFAIVIPLSLPLLLFWLLTCWLDIYAASPGISRSTRRMIKTLL